MICSRYAGPTWRASAAVRSPTFLPLPFLPWVPPPADCALKGFALAAAAGPAARCGWSEACATCRHMRQHCSGTDKRQTCDDGKSLRMQQLLCCGRVRTQDELCTDLQGTPWALAAMFRLAFLRP